MTREIEATVAGEKARVLLGGVGERVLLVHGGWGGASLHWEPVMSRLAERFHVIAPDLPGIGRTDQRGLGSVGAYAAWLVELMDVLKLPDAWFVGNSFGASVVSRLASDHPERCRGLVLVNGFPMPVTPPLLKRLGKRALARRLLRAGQTWAAFSRSAVERGFSDRTRIPSELQALVSSGRPPQVDAFVDILIEGGSPERAKIAPLLLWGADDRLIGTSLRAAEKLCASWPGSKLAPIPRAGHLPQVENPDAFVEALSSFVQSTPVQHTHA